MTVCAAITAVVLYMFHGRFFIMEQRGACRRVQKLLKLTMKYSHAFLHSIFELHYSVDLNELNGDDSQFLK